MAMIKTGIRPAAAGCCWGVQTIQHYVRPCSPRGILLAGGDTMIRSIVTKAVVAMLLVSLLLSQPAATYALEKTGTDGKGSYTVVDSRQYPIIFIPGMAGSTLDTEGGVNALPGSLSI